MLAIPTMEQFIKIVPEDDNILIRSLILINQLCLVI